MKINMLREGDTNEKVVERMRVSSLVLILVQKNAGREECHAR